MYTNTDGNKRKLREKRRQEEKKGKNKGLAFIAVSHKVISSKIIGPSANWEHVLMA
jgi:hypothetical protein